MKIGIIGAGNVGSTIATLLESCAFCDAVVLGDARADLKLAGLRKASAQRVDVAKRAPLAALVKKCDAVVSAARVARPAPDARDAVAAAVEARRDAREGRGAHAVTE